MTITKPNAGDQPWTTAGSDIIDALNGVRSEVADQSSRIVGRNRRTDSAPQTSGTTPATGQKIMDTTATLVAGRTYMVFSPGFGIWNPGTTGGLLIELRIFYTTNGTTPALTSAVLDLSQAVGLSGDRVFGVNIGKPYICTSNMTFRAMLGYSCAATGTAGHYAAADWPTDLIIQDVGLTVVVSGTNF